MGHPCCKTYKAEESENDAGYEYFIVNPSYNLVEPDIRWHTPTMLDITRFTHKHLLFGEDPPECLESNVSYTIPLTLIHCTSFNYHKLTFFHSSVLTLSDIVGKTPTTICLLLCIKLTFST